MAGVISRAEYARMIKELLPPGPAFPREDRASAVAVAIDEIAGLCASIDAQCALLIDESDPLTCAQSFGDWELDWGLPDPCVAAFADALNGEPMTQAQRRAMLLFKTRLLHGQSADFFVRLAAFFGRDATVEELRDEEDHSLDYVWRINIRDTKSNFDDGRLVNLGSNESTVNYGLLADSASITDTDDAGYFDATTNIAAYNQATVLMAANDPLATWGDAMIECVINRYRPAHTTVHFAYL